MTYRQYFFIGFSLFLILGVLLALIFANTFRMYGEKEESGDARIMNAIDIEVNEERIFNNTNMIKNIIRDSSDFENEMTNATLKMNADISQNDSDIKSVHEVLSELKTKDTELQSIDKKMEADWTKQFKSLVTSQQHTKDDLLEQIDDRFMFVDVSEETSMRITELEETIEDAEEQLNSLRLELSEVQYIK